MKLILTTILLAGSLFAGEVQFSFYGDTDQKFKIPYDTNFRAYQIPSDLLAVGTDLRFEIIFSDCEGSSFMLDDIRFPSNALLDFETDDIEIGFSEGSGSAQRVIHPSDTGHVLQLELDPQHTSSDTLWLEAPENSFPAVPEFVGPFLKSNSSVELWNYLPLQDMMPKWTTTRFRSSDPGWHYNTLIENIHNSITSEDSIVNITLRWQYSDHPFTDVQFTERRYIYRHDDRTQISLDQSLINFGLGLGETSGNDSTWGALLVGEEYRDILGSSVFVKKYSLDGLIGSNLYFAYGIGIVREDYPGTSVHTDLVGFQHQSESVGEMNLPIGLQLGVEYEYPGMQIFPPDTNWYHYSIPITDLAWNASSQTTMDSLLLVLGPEIWVDNHDGGSLLFNQLSIWENENMVFNYGTQNHNNWDLIVATNGSSMGWQNSQEAPPGENVLSHRLDFGNSWQGGRRFAGFAEYATNFTSPISVNHSTLRFWMKQPYLMTGIDNYSNALPEIHGISNAFPNPFNGELSLTLSLPPDAATVELIIHDIRGRMVWSETLNPFPGEQQLTWQGRNGQDEAVSSGIFFAGIRVDGVPVGSTQKLILLR